ncbi:MULTISPECIES: hypothetical protein [Selenomonadaceae]|nr:MULTISPECIES: hypothetical protein [Selenomonadaceae]
MGIMNGFLDSLNRLPSGIYTIFGVIIGFGLSWLKDHYNKRPRLYYSLQPKLMPDDWDYALTTKTGESGFAIHVFNTGLAPVILEMLRININGKLVADVFMDYQKIMPYEQYEHSLDKQDYEAIKHWCHKSGVSTLKIVAHTVSGKKINSEMDAIVIAMHNGDFPKAKTS